MQKVTKDEAWAFAIGLAQIDGGKVSDEMLKLIELSLIHISEPTRPY